MKLRSYFFPACLCLLGTLAGCARGEDARSVEVRHYDCEVGVGFYARFAEEEVVVNTKSNSYRLKRQGESADRYASDRVAFTQEKSRAVLTGIDDGPYDGCTQLGT